MRKSQILNRISARLNLVDYAYFDDSSSKLEDVVVTRSGSCLRNICARVFLLPSFDELAQNANFVLSQPCIVSIRKSGVNL